MAKTQTQTGRPPVYSDTDKVFVSATGKTRLQTNSDRRAIINVLVENGGTMTLGELDKHFGFSIRETVLVLKRIGWVRIEGGRK